MAIHTIGDQPGRGTVHARADVIVEALIQKKLRAIRDDNPFERHTSVIGWPSLEDPNERKEQLKLICLELSQSSQVTLVLPPHPIIKAVEQL